MLRVSLAVVAALCLCAVALADVPPTFNYYTMDIVFSLPYNGISEPMRVYYDANNNMSRTEYYNGQDVYIYLANTYDFGTNYQVVPVSYDGTSSEQTCFQNNGSSGASVTIQTAIPDLSTFTNSSSLTYARGVLCENWSYTFTYGSRVNTYNFYISSVSGAPVQYHMMGYDSLYGSHYDEYILDYNTYSTDAIDPSIFAPPAMDCGELSDTRANRNTRGALGEIENPHHAMKQWDARFEEFKGKFKKSYASHAEHAKRHSVFHHNYRFIEAHNHKQLSYKTAVNHFADTTREERKVMHGVQGSKLEAHPVPEGQPKPKYTGPVQWDWRTQGAVTYVKDQGMCGSCWSFGTAESIEGAWFMKTGKLIPMSEQAFMDCSWPYGNAACDGGLAPGAYQWALDNGGGVPSEATYGLYEMADGVCHVNDYDVEFGAVITGYVNVTSDVDAVLNAIYVNGPLAVAIDAAFEEFVFYSSGVYYNPECGNTVDDLDHEVLAIGFGTASVGGDYWIIKNSWSQYWGLDGYVWMSRLDNNCGVATSANYALVD